MSERLRRRRLPWDPEGAVARHRRVVHEGTDCEATSYRPVRPRIARRDGDHWIAAESRWVFTHDNWDYHLTELVFYADGLIARGGLAMTPDELRSDVENGRITTSVPEGGEVLISGLCSATADGQHRGTDPGEFLREVDDIFDRLRGRPDSEKRCLLAVQRWLDDESESNRRRVLKAFESVPHHLKIYILRDQDEKVGAFLDLASDDPEDHVRARTYFDENIDRLLRRGAKR